MINSVFTALTQSQNVFYQAEGEVKTESRTKSRQVFICGAAQLNVIYQRFKNTFKLMIVAACLQLIWPEN